MLLARDFIIWALVPVVFFTGQQARAARCLGRTTYLSSERNGSFTSPGFPYQYTDNENCQWSIYAPSGKRVLLYFTSFQLEGASCVSIYDGPSSHYPLLAKKCGSDIPAPIYSSGREMFVNFRSNSSGWYTGFKAKYLSLSNSAACSSINNSDSTGVVFSPGFSWFNRYNKPCNWYIRAPYGTINLTFTTFDLQPPRFSSCSDYVIVTYASGHRNNRRLCGRYQTPFTMTSAGRYLNIEFSGSSSNSYKGFMAFYQKEVGSTTYYTTRRPTLVPFTSRPLASYGCAFNSKNVLGVDDTSSIASPFYPNPVPYGYYPTSSYSTCTWRITTDKDYLELTFDQMSIGRRCGTTCYCGNVQVYEGNSVNGRHLGTFCAGETSKVTSKENAMFVTYRASGNSGTFKATIRAKTSVLVPAIVVPLVIGVLLFGVIFAVIKCTKIIPSTGQAGSSNVYEVPLQTLPPSGDSVPPQYSSEHPQGTTNMEFVANEETEPA